MRTLREVAQADLRSLILWRLRAERSKNEELSARVKQMLGKDQMGTPDIRVQRVQNVCENWVADTLVKRLKHGNRDAPLFSSRDIDSLASLLLREFERNEGRRLDAGERVALARFTKSVFANLLDVVEFMGGMFRQNTYDGWWRWLETVINFATERGIQAADLPTCEWAADEISRRLFTKEQYRVLSQREIEKLTDVDVLKRIFLQPLLDMVAETEGEEGRRELERELEAAFVQYLRETVEKVRPVAERWLNEEIERIYR